MIEIVSIERLELGFEPRPWPFATARRGEIDAHFAALRRSNPALWNGRTLMLYQHAIRGSVFHGTYLETDYASMLAWRHWGFPDAGVKNCFALGGLQGSDGAFLLGVMAAHTASPGSIYFPAGVPDLSDVDGARVDLARNVIREIAEETGLTPSDFAMEEGWTTVLAGPRIAQVKMLRARETASALRERILAHIAGEAQPELSDVRIVAGPADFDPQMPAFVTAFLQHLWSRDAKDAR